MDTSSSTTRPVEKPVLDALRQQQARAYSRVRRRLSLLDTGLALVLLLVLVFTGISRWFTGLRHWPAPAAAVVFFLVLTVGWEVVTSPLSYYNGFILPHRYGLSTQKLFSWLGDLAKGGILSLVLGSAAVAAVYWLLISFPDYWWAIAWGLLLAVSILISLIAPIFLVPLFYKVRPLSDADLKSRLERLAEKAGARVHGIFVLNFSAKTTAANAALMGLGRTRRIVLSDTLIQQYSLPEIEVVTAHEIGHHLNRDIFRLFLVQTAVSLVLMAIVAFLFRAVAAPLGYSGIADPAALPLLALLFGGFSTLFSPLLNTYSRHVESQADAYAIGLTGDPAAFIDSMTRLTNQNLAVAAPAAWEEALFYSHPSYANRIKPALRLPGQPSGETT